MFKGGRGQPVFIVRLDFDLAVAHLKIEALIKLLIWSWSVSVLRCLWGDHYHFSCACGCFYVVYRSLCPEPGDIFLFGIGHKMVVLPKHRTEKQ